jgi:hypothetical protein
MRGVPMNEAEWLACDPDEMYFRGVAQLRSSARQKDLFCLACARLIWNLLGDDARKPFEWLEEHVGERVKPRSTGHVRELFEGPAQSLYDAHHWREGGVSGAAAHVAYDFWVGWYEYAFPNLCEDYAIFREVLGEKPHNLLVSIIRDIFGNPFRPLTISPTVLAWNDAAVVRLAQAAYDERHLPEGTLDNSRLAVPADALEEAGCTSEDILGHLRGPGPHVRGCWPVDLCLGKA